MALLPGSPAIDAGNNALIPAGVTTDQRGLARIVNGVVDIGAFESSLFTIAVTSGSGQATGIFTAFPAPLVATVTANNPIEPVAGGLVTFTPPSSGASAILTGSPATISATGTATVTATANGIVGSYTVSAGARGITNTANFNLTNDRLHPTITTTPSLTTATLGTRSVTLNDTAVLSGGYNETGTITFTLYLGSTLVNTETVPVSGSGTYTTPTGYTLPPTGTVIGIYQWDASYGGDIDNYPASENNGPAEQVTVNPASPAITTTPSMTTVTLGTSSVTLNDTAVLSAGYYETGSITFTLYLGSTLVDTETVPVTGNGNYTTPTGYTLPATGTVTGTYQWDASYNGDTNNTSASENDAPAEQVTVNPANPTITTTPSISNVTLGASSVTLNDTAVLSEGYHETGSITFTLFLGSTLVDTENDVGQRRRHVHGADRLHAAGDGYRDRHLPVGRQLQRRHQQYLGQRERRPGRAGDGESRQPDDRHDTEHIQRDAGRIVGDLERHCGAVGRLSRDRLDHVHAPPGQHAGRYRERRRSAATARTRRRQATRCRRRVP